MEILSKEQYGRQRYNQKKIFAEGFCFKKIFIFFVIGCIAGTVYEEVLTFLKSGEWESRQGIIYGPFNPIYGIGFAGIIALLAKNIHKRKWYISYVWCCAITGVAEYTLSILGEYLFHSTSWDYSNHYLNIAGRTTIPFILIWGLGGMIILYVLYPVISRWIEKIPYKVGMITYYIIFVFLILNMLVSYTALIRQAMRHQGIAPYTVVGEICDDIYNDNFLKEIYPNMEHK